MCFVIYVLLLNAYDHGNMVTWSNIQERRRKIFFSVLNFSGIPSSSLNLNPFLGQKYQFLLRLFNQILNNLALKILFISFKKFQSAMNLKILKL